MRSDYDVIVIGAGPAGLAAAGEAAGCGLGVLVLDEQEAPGGQIYREVERIAATLSGGTAALGEDYAHGEALVRAFRRVPVDYRPASIVWQVDADGRVACTGPDGARVFRAGHIISATGALERPVPLPGWTLPGVMGAAAAQVLLKSAGAIPDGPLVLAGNGALLLVVAVDLLKAGACIAALVETTGARDFLAAAPFLPGALRSMGQLRRGLGLRAALRRAGVPWYAGAHALAVLGTERAAGLAFTAGGRRREVAADTVLLHEGVVPDTQLTRHLRCEHRWVSRQRCWQPVLDAWGHTTVERLSVAGDSGGVAGARAAEVSGRLAALNTAVLLGRLQPAERDRRAVPLRGELRGHLALRPLLERLFVPRAAVAVLADETVVCRCEEVSAGAIRRAVAEGSRGPNQLKAYTRAGMGPCQGRMCGLTVGEVVARAMGATPEAVGYFRVRPPLKPITLGELATLELPPDVPAADERPA